MSFTRPNITELIQEIEEVILRSENSSENKQKR
jgi:hypothetical protein